MHLTSDAGGLAGQLEAVTLSPAAQAFNAQTNGMKTLRAGFTTVRNLGDGDGAVGPVPAHAASSNSPHRQLPNQTHRAIGKSKSANWKMASPSSR
mgnify:CR=1 FL=1